MTNNFENIDTGSNVWEAEPPDLLPLTDSRMIDQSRNLNQNIAKHKPVSFEQNWDNIKLAFPTKQHKKINATDKNVKINGYIQFIKWSCKAIFDLITNLVKYLFILIGFFLSSPTKKKKILKQGVHKKKKAIRKKNYPAKSAKRQTPKSKSKQIFVPTTNMYCYYCTRKLGLKAWESNGKYSCEQCHSKNY
jgi:hypothetical protein